MNIDDYKYIVTIANQGSFNSAAKELFIAQPSLSQRIKYVEKSIGINIFIRGPKGIQLTPEGKCVVRYAKAILNCEKSMHQELSEMRTGISKLCVGASQLINTYMFDRLISYFYEEHPKVEVSFIERPSPELHQMLIAGELDVAICYLPVTSQLLKYESIFQDRFVLVPAHGGKLQEKLQAHASDSNFRVPISFLDNEPFALTPPGTALYQHVNALKEQYQVAPDIKYSAKSFQMLYSRAKSGNASTILFESMFNPAQEHEPYYYLEGNNNALDVAIAWRKDVYLCQAAKKMIRVARKVRDELLNESAQL